MKYYEVFISSENQEQADAILNSLLEKKLVTGGQFINTPARFLWKGNIVSRDYCTITSSTTEKHKAIVIEDVKQNSLEDVPMLRFFEFSGNEELLKWIDETLA
jgi:uncharacterized protein involved in tolerance to divalent cations